MSDLLTNSSGMVQVAFVLGLLMSLSVLVAGLWGLIRPAPPDDHTPSVAGLARLIAIVTATSHVIAGGLLIWNTSRTLSDVTPALRVVAYLGWDGILLTAAMIAFSVMAWKDGYWKPIGRGHYALVTLASLGYLWALWQIGVLGG